MNSQDIVKILKMEVLKFKVIKIEIYSRRDRAKENIII